MYRYTRNTDFMYQLVISTREHIRKRTHTSTQKKTGFCGSDDKISLYRI